MKKEEITKWSKRVVFFAVFGVTGCAAFLVYKLYRVSKGLDDDNWDDLKL